MGRLSTTECTYLLTYLYCFLLICVLYSSYHGGGTRLTGERSATPAFSLECSLLLCISSCS